MFRQLAPIDTEIPNKSSPSYLSEESVGDRNYNRNNETINNSLKVASGRSRIPSLTSLLTDPVYLSKNEKIGIRKLAKACTRNLVSRNDNYLESQNSDYADSVSVLPENPRSKKASKKSIMTSDNWKTYFENEKALKNLSESSNRLQSLINNVNDNQEEDNEKAIADGTLIPKPGHGKRKNLNAKNDFPHEMEKLRLSHSYSVRHLNEEAAGSVETLNDTVSNHPYNMKKYMGSKRIVVVQDLPPFSGLNSVLSTVSGGPLERVVYRSNINKHNSTRNGFIVELHYLNHVDAEAFIAFAETGLCIVNGRRLNVTWANKENTEDLGNLHPLVPDYLLNEMKNEGASRCLIFKKTPKQEKPPKAPTKTYPYPKTHFSELDMESIKQDFSIFGGIVDVSPVISRKICFSIQFFDVRSAIVAKRECECTGSSMNDKYMEWSIWYGKDPTDKPCITI